MSEDLSPPPEIVDGSEEKNNPQVLGDSEQHEKPDPEADQSIPAAEAATDKAFMYENPVEAADAMRAGREELSLADRIEDDPRWQAAYEAALRPSVQAISDHPDDRERAIQNEKRARADARAAADAALQTDYPEAFAGYMRYGQYDTPVNDRAFEQAFPQAGNRGLDRQRSVAEIDEWIAKHPEQAVQYRGVVGPMRDAAVRGAYDRGEPISAEDTRRLQVIAETGKKISSLPFYDQYGTRDLLNRDPSMQRAPSGESETETGETPLDTFGDLVGSDPALYRLVEQANRRDETLDTLHQAMEEYTALLNTDPSKAVATGESLKTQLSNERAAALQRNDAAAAEDATLRMALLDSLLRQYVRSGDRNDYTLAA